MSDHYWDGANFAARNASDLLESSELISVTGRYGVATSLAILSTEESMKAVTFASLALQDATSSNPYKKMLSDHKKKHASVAIALSLAKIFEVTKHIIEEIESDSSIPRESRVAELVNRSTAYSKELLKDSSSLARLRDWQDSADHIKKAGFYVDEVAGRWTCPFKISESEWQSKSAVAREMKACIDLVLSFPDLEKLRKFYTAAETTPQK